MNLGEILSDQNWFLSLIFFFLLSLSLVSWYVIFKKIMFFRYEEKSLANFGQKSDSFLSASVGKAFDLIEKNKTNNSDLLAKKLSLIFDEVKDRLSFGQNFLGSIANLSPFIGLFGTVIGVYLALMDISSQGSANISVVAKPIGEALIATAIGLWCAIPASFAFYFFSKASAKLVKKSKILVEEKLLEVGGLGK